MEWVVDGDTLRVESGRFVRLIGVDAPEATPGRLVECFGLEASAFLAALLPPGTGLRLVAGAEAEDRFGRALAHVYRMADGVFVNALLVQGGLARATAVEPATAHAGELSELERGARRARAGLWGACPSPAPPGQPPSARRASRASAVSPGPGPGAGGPAGSPGPGAAAWPQTQQVG